MAGKPIDLTPIREQHERQAIRADLEALCHRAHKAGMTEVATVIDLMLSMESGQLAPLSS